MVNPQLVTYIKNQLAQGFEINSIKLNLARSGYHPEQIEEAVAAAYKKPMMHSAKMLLLVGGGAVILAAMITFIILTLAGTEEIQPSVVPEKIMVLEKEILPVEEKPVTATAGSTEQVTVQTFGALSSETVRKIEDIKQVAVSEPERAKNLCLGLATTIEKDTCLLKVGTKVNKEEFCLEISEAGKKDSCYVNLALNLRNYGFCNNILDQVLREACIGLG